MSRGCARSPRCAQGLALVAVLWIVVALSILVTGMSYAVRGEVRQVSAARHAVAAHAAGDAAIQLTLQEMLANSVRPNRLQHVQVHYQDQAIDVEVMPLNGLIDINNAPEPLLTRLFALAGQVDAATASALAQSVVQVRSKSTLQDAKPAGFEAIEDLLQVPGITYPLYASISALVTVDGGDSGGVNPLAAPLAVLMVLADGNAANASRVAAARDAGQDGVDTTTTLDGAFLSSGSARRFRLQARVAMLDGRWALISRTVDLQDGMRDGLPWRTLQMQRSLEAG